MAERDSRYVLASTSSDALVLLGAVACGWCKGCIPSPLSPLHPWHMSKGMASNDILYCRASKYLHTLPLKTPPIKPVPLIRTCYRNLDDWDNTQSVARVYGGTSHPTSC